MVYRSASTFTNLLTLWVVLTTHYSDWLFHDNLSTSVKNAPAAINTRYNHNFCQWLTNFRQEKIPNITSLKPEQTQAEEGLLAGKDVLAILPTGFGKSLIYRVFSIAKTSHFSLPAASRLSRARWFSRALPFLSLYYTVSLRENERLLVVYV